MTISCLIYVEQVMDINLADWTAYPTERFKKESSAMGGC